MRAATVVLSAVALSGCAGSPVEVTPPEAPSDVASACRELAAALPDMLEGGSRREVRPNSPLTAAWGRPAIVLRCGVPRPKSYAPDASLIGVNGVDWWPEKTEWGYVFTTVRRRADVEVRVPKEYTPEVNPLADLSLIVASRL